MDKEVTFNLNQWVKFKLTDLGKDIYYHQYDKLNEYLLSQGYQPIERIMPEVDDDGYSSMQLWCFIELYGPYFRITKPNVIDPLTLTSVSSSEERKEAESERRARYINETDVYKLVEPTGTANVHCSQIDELPRVDVTSRAEVANDIIKEIESISITFPTTAEQVIDKLQTKLAELKEKYAKQSEVETDYTETLEDIQAREESIGI